MIWNNKIFPSLYVSNGKTLPYASKEILRHYLYRSDPKLVPGIFSIRVIPCICHACTAISYLSWYYKIKKEVNQPRHGRVYNCKYSQILGCYNNWILMILLDDGIDKLMFL